MILLLNVECFISWTFIYCQSMLFLRCYICGCSKYINALVESDRNIWNINMHIKLTDTLKTGKWLFCKTIKFDIVGATSKKKKKLLREFGYTWRCIKLYRIYIISSSCTWGVSYFSCTFVSEAVIKHEKKRSPFKYNCKEWS